MGEQKVLQQATCNYFEKKMPPFCAVLMREKLWFKTSIYYFIMDKFFSTRTRGTLFRSQHGGKVRILISSFFCDLNRRARG